MATNNFQIKGIIEKIGDTESKGQNFMVRELVLRVDDGNYKQFISFQLSQDRCDLADNFSEGQECTVHFSLKGREWNGRYLTNLSAWRIVSEQGTPNVPQNAGNGPVGAVLEEPSTELPF